MQFELSAIVARVVHAAAVTSPDATAEEQRSICSAICGAVWLRQTPSHTPSTTTMVSPTINRVKGKTLEQRRREMGRMKKKNKIEAGKAMKSGLVDRGKTRAGIGKKKNKKKEQRARLLAAGGTSGKMEI